LLQARVFFTKDSVIAASSSHLHASRDLTSASFSSFPALLKSFLSLFAHLPRTLEHLTCLALSAEVVGEPVLERDRDLGLNRGGESLDDI
jgi:hypothetical protein